MAAEILVVDDDADIREMLQLVLEEDGFAVVTAADGSEALQLLSTGLRPQVILLDLMMTGMNGYDFCAEYAKRTTDTNVPILVLTGHGRADDAQASLGVEAMNKPVSLEVLLGAIRRLASRSQATT